MSISSNDEEKRGRGRPPGSVNQMSKRARELARQSGRLPHEILLSIARGEPQEVEAVNETTGAPYKKKLLVTSLDEVRSAAAAAAPYYAPKISTVELINGVSDDDLNSIISRLATEAGVSLGALGIHPEGEDQGAEGEEGTNPPPRTRIRLD